MGEIREDKEMERHGTLIRVDKNGTEYYEGFEKCDRCDGKGIYYIGVLNGRLLPSPVDQGVCFKCGGSGEQRAKWKIYTPEYEKKLEERRAKRRAKWLEEHKEELEAQEREREAKRQQEEAERALREKQREEAERAEQERKANSKHIGQVGDKIELTVTFIYTASYEVPAFTGWGKDIMHIHIFRDEEGNTLTWKTQKGLGWYKDGKKWVGDYLNEWILPEAGQKLHLKGTIKAHGEYKDEKQTELLRVKVEPLD